MEPLSSLAAMLRDALKTKQIGSPVALRLTILATADHGLLTRIAAVAIHHSAALLGASPASTVAFGNPRIGQLAALVRLSGGQSALVSVGTTGSSRPTLDALVWGNRGMLAFQGGQPGVGVFTDRPLTDAESWILEQLDRSLADADEASATTRSPAAGAGTVTPFGRNVKPSKPPSPPYGVLLVAGDHTHQPGYAAALAADPRCRLVGLTDEAGVSERRRKLNEALARRFDVPLLPDLSAALKRDDVHIVSICAEPMRRGRIIVQAAQAGKHLYLDKPLCGSLADADAVRKAIREAGVVAHMWSFVHARYVRAAQAALAQKEFGEPVALHFDACFAKGHAGSARLGESRREVAVPDEFELPDSKRELTNVGVYPLVSLFWLLRRPVRRVFASTGNYFFREHQQNGMEDFGQILLELEGGALATISAGRTGWQSHPAGGFNRLLIAGSTGDGIFDAWQPRVEVYSDAPLWQPPERDPDDPMAMWAGPKAAQFQAKPKQDWITAADTASHADVKHFLDCIEQGRESDVPAEIAAAATEVLLAAYRSAANGTVVSLPLPR